MKSIATLVAFCAFPLCAQQSLGLFDNRADVGTVKQAGTTAYDPAAKTYTISASGENMWATADAFQFVWKQISVDVSIAADITFPTTTGDPHKKAALIVRQSLDADSAYADIAVHGNGMTSLQARDEKGATTHEVQANTSYPQRVRLTKEGDYFYMSLNNAAGEPLRLSGGSLRVALKAPFYIGLAVCAHNPDAFETAVFSNVEITQPPAPKLYSTLETITVTSTDRRVVQVVEGRIEAPNWAANDDLLYNGGGKLYRIPSTGGTPAAIETGTIDRLNNDHGISPDGTLLALSDQSQTTGPNQRRSVIYTVPITGGTPTRITQNAPSYWHGWSPDGKTLTYVGDRGGELDIYTIPVTGGEETRLTTAAGLDDGPEYSPDGQYIYFNSERTGHMQIWRMKPDGSEQTQITNSELNDWFPHLSPNGQRMVFLSYEPGVTGHPEDKDVQLRMMSMADGRITVLAKLFGGQGTINVPSWAPDSRRLSFVSYQLIK
jgi:hypothetical protein